jgi:hypothetical protein
MKFNVDSGTFASPWWGELMLDVPGKGTEQGWFWEGLVTSLNYFSALVTEVAETSVGEDYWKHVQTKVTQLERMWLDRTPAGGSSAKDEMTETK